MGWVQIKKFIDEAGEGLRATRERALLCVAYDTMARRAELVAFNRGDFKFLEDGSGRALIRRSKTDQAGEGHTAYLAPVTVHYLKDWLGIGADRQGGGVSAADRHGVRAQTKTAAGEGAEIKDAPGAHRCATECSSRREYLQARRQAHQAGAGGHCGDQWALDPGGGDAGPLGAEY